MKAWHFLREDKKLGYSDGRLVRVGHTFKCDPESLDMCRSGFHASQKIIDALTYAPGPIVCRVDLSGKIIKGHDKCVASERTVIAMADATEVLHEMACWSAEQALKLIKNPDPRAVAAIEAKRKWLRGEINDAELAAAGDAAWAAWDAAWAADAAAGGAAWAAADAAAWAADAAWAAAWAADATARGAARAAQNKQLTRMVNKLLRDTK